MHQMCRNSWTCGMCLIPDEKPSGLAGRNWCTRWTRWQMPTSPLPLRQHQTRQMRWPFLPASADPPNSLIRCSLVHFQEILTNAYMELPWDRGQELSLCNACKIWPNMGPQAADEALEVALLGNSPPFHRAVWQGTAAQQASQFYPGTLQSNHQVFLRAKLSMEQI